MPPFFSRDFLEVLRLTGEDLSLGHTGKGCWDILPGGCEEAPRSGVRTLSLREVITPPGPHRSSYNMSESQQLISKGALSAKDSFLPWQVLPE